MDMLQQNGRPARPPARPPALALRAVLAITFIGALAGPSTARADDGVSRQTGGIINTAIGGVVLATGVAALIFAPVVLGRGAPGDCAQYDGNHCVVAYVTPPSDDRTAIAASLLVGGAIAIALSAVLLWTGIADATSGDDPEDVSLSLRRDGFALRF